MAIFGGGQTLRSASARENEREITCGAQRYRGRVLWGLKTRYKRFVLGVSGYFPVGVTAPPTGDARRAAASGNCHSGDIVVTPRHGPASR